jgi:hypothetical protein
MSDYKFKIYKLGVTYESGICNQNVTRVDRTTCRFDRLVLEYPKTKRCLSRLLKERIEQYE